MEVFGELHPLLGSFFIQFLGAVFLFREGTERVFLFKCILTGTKVLSRLSGKFRAGVRGCDQIVRAFQLGVFESVVGSFCGYTLCTMFQALIQIVARLHLFREGIFSGYLATGFSVKGIGGGSLLTFPCDGIEGGTSRAVRALLADGIEVTL